MQIHGCPAGLSRPQWRPPAPLRPSTKSNFPQVRDGSIIDVFLLLPKEGPPRDEYLNTCTNDKSGEQLHGVLFFRLFRNSLIPVWIINIYRNLFLLTAYFPWSKHLADLFPCIRVCGRSKLTPYICSCQQQ